MIRLAAKVASNSKFSRARVGCVITKSGRVLATGFNRIGYTKFLKRPYPESIHAEQQAILHLLKHNRLQDLVGAVLYVTRINKLGKLCMAKPCKFCSNLIRSVGIKKIVFSNRDGSILEEEIQ